MSIEASLSARTSEAVEWNFDGIVGPTHNYAGLSPGNLASEAQRGSVSDPRSAALQGLAKMKFLHELGVPQAFLPPHPRPALAWLAAQGFGARSAEILERAARDAPERLVAAYSASSMWSANAATVTPASDSGDGRVHLTAANLASEVHRSLEPPYTAALLRAVFSSEEHFVHHAPLPTAQPDEGAANHLRIALDYGSPGIHLFVFGAPAAVGAARPRRHPARQSEAASRSVARQHGLDPTRVLFLQQHPEAIDAGVFHNDVIATGDRDFLWRHRRAWSDGDRVVDSLRSLFERSFRTRLRCVSTPEDQVPLDLAVSSYLFNCQLVQRPGGPRAWVGPEECREDPVVRAALEAMVAGEAPIDELHYVDLRQSMRNGGGPACLRLRVVLRAEETAALHPGVLFSEGRYDALVACVKAHYRDRVEAHDLRDPSWAEECLAAQRAILEVLGLGGQEELVVA
jgi:succinylarginine dihydrolase